MDNKAGYGYSTEYLSEDPRHFTFYLKQTKTKQRNMKNVICDSSKHSKLCTLIFLKKKIK